MIKINKNILKYAVNVEELIFNLEKLQKKIMIQFLKKENRLFLNYLFNKANEKNLKLFY